ncbi:hypothetical protein C1H87_08330 [Flavivirga eckloniae]|uniref:Uncharacterized protein n=2 Tax=Flavivirga eckloniae TaxID=1803846 RepID=A0A2K9PNS0_9FLAO|nr:hypothetical protein C1H87_08330 [Flavivirga eckloniae]
MVLLFAFTKKKLPIDTSFRRFYQHISPAKIQKLDLESNRYYIAGAAEDKIYLGHPSSPLSLTVVDSALQKKQIIRLSIDQDSLLIRNPQLRVIPPYFFLMDGTVPYILRGNTKDWKAYSISETIPYFTDVQAIDSISLAVSAMSSKTRELALGTIHLSDSATITLSHKLLQKQVDGIFDVDGKLLYNRQRKQLIYTYFYRNQYIVVNDNLQLQLRGKTIDSISQAQIKVITTKKEKKLAPSLMVNRYSATSGDHLFINSQILGRKEHLVSWKKSTTIDVYNIEKKKYKFSFYVKDIGENKLKAFYMLDNKLIGLIGNNIISYQLNDRYFDESSPPIEPQNLNKNI